MLFVRFEGGQATLGGVREVGRMRAHSHLRVLGLVPSELMVMAGLCSDCIHKKLVVSAKGSEFVLCRHPDLPKYPRLPVLQCAGFRAARER